jgi:cytochrome oxidase Cu insertion factor (SCO1/SenC/PrrC family)
MRAGTAVRPRAVLPGRLLLAAGLVAGVLATPAAAQLGPQYDPPEPGTYELPPIKSAGDGDVLLSDGEARKLLDLLKGRITVLSFIYTRCADPRACPFSSGVLYRIHGESRTDPEIARNLQLLTFSFDPENDTPTVMAEYGSSFRSEDEGCDWRFLTTRSTKELAPILEVYGQRVDRRKDADDPKGPLHHLVRVYLIDRDARIRNIYSFGLMDARLLLADVRTLLLEEERAGSR